MANAAKSGRVRRKNGHGSSRLSGALRLTGRVESQKIKDAAVPWAAWSTICTLCPIQLQSSLDRLRQWGFPRCRGDFDRLLGCGDSLGKAAYGRIGSGQRVEAAGRVIARQLTGLFCQLYGFARIAAASRLLRRQQPSEVVAGIDVLRIEFHGPLKMLPRFRGFSHADEDFGQSAENDRLG